MGYLVSGMLLLVAASTTLFRGTAEQAGAPSEALVCGHCKPEQPSSPEGANWITLTFSQSSPGKGDCVENDANDCVTELKKCSFQGFVYLTEVDTRATVVPTPAKSANEPWGWEKISQPGAQERWKANLGTGDVAKIVACGDKWDGLEFTYTPEQGGAAQTFKLEFTCDNCKRVGS